MPSKQEPMLMESPLSGRVYVVTRYEASGDGLFMAKEKFDITEQFEALARVRRERDDR